MRRALHDILVILAILAVLMVIASLVSCASSNQFTPDGAMTADGPPAPASTHNTKLGRITEVHDPGEVTGHIEGPCKTTITAGGDILPDPVCTPGSIDPALTPLYVCTHSTAAYRPPRSEEHTSEPQ